ncbi:MAG: CusA/CzcA family heavy metal efflux RND transporter [Candidatus Aminicenantes bacterium]|nr:CusA/CzcA family heavy metal efflux RND transporter [Candidatus Aminicenantes bacterium]NIM81391.1 CusA/CzcA family heavy metal efflux RND transporter [Candidatus Aminicenantes bacterium]NIN20800.1 CusA/CzcA family heavy metal efflux RND transporter [Candidatus Aminicenantes bacterium]NIN44577.1 CusA/CzcA family heavy metal efflux RND transporter [Candidatus Aminicenantes bacterium]NIN87402.1 CusA/CzcA family heavy metal efflux RND transporter [Candidatus Aminicenantes bacterium]
MKKLIIMTLGKRVFTFLIIAFIITAGILAYRNLKIDVFPDPSPVLVQLHCDAEGMAPEEVEKFVSYPLETSLYGLPHIEKVTSFSTFGLSTVNVYFDDSIDIHFARQLVAAQLPAIQEKLPDFVEAPELGPITTGLGMVYIYALSGDQPGIELRTLQDWVIKFQLQTIPGIAAVLSQGGDVKQFQVIVDAEMLIKYKVGLHTVIESIKKSSKNITAGYIVKNREEYIIRGIGLMEHMDALKKVLIKVSGATPIYLENVAEIKIGNEIKRGDAMVNTEDTTVSGIVMKLIGVNTAELIDKINQRVEEINAGLPEGIRVVPVYNQAAIIKAAFRTVSEALLIGIILVSLILFLFINDFSSSLVSTLAIPFSVFVTFIVMRLTDMTADLMSFGGLAIGIGLLVDATVVVVENISRNREELKKAKNDIDVIISSVTQVLRPLTYAMIMIIASFLPILTLQGVEGKLFRPFGFTLLIAIVSAIFYAVFFSPVLMNVLGKRKVNATGFIFEYLKKAYLHVFDFFYRRENLTILVFLVVFILSLVVLFTTGSEFIPALNEQTIQLEINLPQSTTLKETSNFVNIIHKEVIRLPEVKSAYGRIGRGEGGTHPHPVNIGHTIINLKQRKHWQVHSFEELIEKIRVMVKQRVPGVLLNFTQPIKHNLDHLITGVRADLAIKVFGDDYHQLLIMAENVKFLMGSIKGVADVQVTRVSGQNEIAIKLDREKMARYGLNPEDVLEELEASVGGKNVSKIYQGDVVYDVFVRYSPQYRKSIRDLNNVLVHTENGQMIPLSFVASVKEATGFSNINRENGKRYITVQCNVRGRDIGSIVTESKRKIYSQLSLPFGYYLTWGGQFELKQRAEKRLYIVLFITFFLIVVLLFDYLKCWRDIIVILINLPVSLSGGIVSLWLAGAYLSVPSTIGFLALLGIALENTLILISFFKRMTGEIKDFDAAIRESVGLRLRPILMTKFTTIIGLFPLLFSTGIGSEIQKPLVIVVIGGIFFSIFTTLLLMPVIYKKFYKS